jgi:hypothetical protein
MREEAAKLLVCIYTEVNSVVPVMDSITPAMLGMEQEVFNQALNILYTGGFISGVSIKFGDEDDKPPVVAYSDALLTKSGAHYVESEVGLDPDLPKLDKLQLLEKKAQEWGWHEVAADIAKAIREFST